MMFCHVMMYLLLEEGKSQRLPLWNACLWATSLLALQTLSIAEQGVLTTPPNSDIT